jgi:hypothetical protein
MGHIILRQVTQVLGALKSQERQRDARPPGQATTSSSRRKQEVLGVLQKGRGLPELGGKRKERGGGRNRDRDRQGGRWMERERQGEMDGKRNGGGGEVERKRQGGKEGARKRELAEKNGVLDAL